MNSLSYEEIIKDEAYSKGYLKAKKQAEIKYNKLFEASKAWFHIYESTFGTPDEEGNQEFWTLRKLLKMPC